MIVQDVEAARGMNSWYSNAIVEAAMLHDNGEADLRSPDSIPSIIMSKLAKVLSLSFLRYHLHCLFHSHNNKDLK
jgi:hypothetical protein